MKPTVYLVHYSCKPGGIEVLLPTIIREVKSNKIKVFVIRPFQNNESTVYEDVSVEIKYGSNYTIIALLKFLFFVLKDRNGIYHLFNTGPYFLFILRLLSVKRIVYSIHGTVYWKTSFQKLIRKIFWRLAVSRKIIFTANSSYSSEVFFQSVSKKTKPVVLYNPIDIGRFNCNGRNNSEGLNKVIYVGRLVNGKNLEKWIDVASFILSKEHKIAFEIYGTGPCQAILQKKINALGLESKIKLKGYVKDIESVYKNADLLLFLSEYESFGNVAAESILCGTPVITFDIPAMKEVFKDFPQFLIQNNNEIEKSIYDKLKIISELKDMAIEASVSFSKCFNSTAHISKLESIYNNCI